MRSIVGPLIFAALLLAQRPGTNYDESKVPKYVLPDPLVLANGQPVRDARTWTTKRRPEILELFRSNVFGRSPARPAAISFEPTEINREALGGSAFMSGKVAMELAGHWEPGVMQGLTEDKKGLGDKTGWFPFPAVDGGEGDPAAAMGGGDAWACAKDAPDVCVDFIKYLLSDDVQKGFAENDMGLPTNPAASGSVKDPVLGDLLKFRDNAPFVQLYLDTALGENVGGAMNDEIALVFAGQSSAEAIPQKMQEAADNG